MLIPYIIKESMSDSSIIELIEKYDYNAKTINGENLLTIYLNKIKKNDKLQFLDILLDSLYEVQTSLIRREKLVYVYNNIFDINSNKEKISYYKDKFFNGIYPNLSYWALTVPFNQRCDLFEKFYNPEDVFITDKVNIFEDIFSQGQMLFSSIDECNGIKEKIQETFEFLIQQGKIPIQSLGVLTENKKIEKDYYDQFLKYHNFTATVDNAVQNLTSQLNGSLLIKNNFYKEHLSGEKELSKMKSKLLNFYFDKKLIYKTENPKNLSKI